MMELMYQKLAKARTIFSNKDPQLIREVLPKEAANIVKSATHTSVGHRSPSQLSKHVAQHFGNENLNMLTDSFVENCAC